MHLLCIEYPDVLMRGVLNLKVSLVKACEFRMFLLFFFFWFPNNVHVQAGFAAVFSTTDSKA